MPSFTAFCWLGRSGDIWASGERAMRKQEQELHAFLLLYFTVKRAAMPGVTGEKLYSSHTESLISVFFKELIKFSAAFLYSKLGDVVAPDTSRWTVMHRLMDDWIRNHKILFYSFVSRVSMNSSWILKLLFFS